MDNKANRADLLVHVQDVQDQMDNKGDKVERHVLVRAVLVALMNVQLRA